MLKIFMEFLRKLDTVWFMLAVCLIAFFSISIFDHRQDTWGICLALISVSSYLRMCRLILGSPLL